MAIEFKTQEYSTGKHFLVFPDHYVCVAQIFNKDDSTAVTIDSRKIIKAGTLWPSNDGSVQGIVFSDLDVTDGDQSGSLLVHGFVKTAALPVVPASTAIAALTQVVFLPLAAVVVTLSATAFAAAASTIEAADVEKSVVVSIAGGLFRTEASDADNWTVTAESTTKMVLDRVVLSADLKTATLVFKSSAAGAAGSNTVTCSAACVSNGNAPSAAITVITLT